MSEFSRIVSLQELGERESVHDISASEAECAAVAARFGLEAVDDLRATVRLRRTGDGLIRLLAEYHAAVIQICVVTLDPVRDVIESCVDVQFGPEGERDAREVVIDLAEDMEPLTGDSIDIGEIVARNSRCHSTPIRESQASRNC